jgi:hypothetical protein
MRPYTETLLYLALLLDKPISCFFPGDLADAVQPQDADPLEQELLIQSRNLDRGDLKCIIAQAKALVDLSMNS